MSSTPKRARTTPPLRIEYSPTVTTPRINLPQELFRSQAQLRERHIDMSALEENLTHELLAAKDRSFNEGVRHGMWLMQKRIDEMSELVARVTYSNMK